MEEEILVLCLNNKNKENAKLFLTEKENSVVIRADLKNFDFEVEEENYFDALIKLRKNMEKNKIELLCQGCCRNVYPSGMILEMGYGRKAYKLALGQPAKSENLIDIFAPGEKYSTIKEQRKYFEEWIKSLK